MITTIDEIEKEFDNMDFSQFISIPGAFGYLTLCEEKVKSFIRTLLSKRDEALLEEIRGMKVPDTGNEKMVRHASEGEMMKEFQRHGFNSALSLIEQLLAKRNQE